MERVITLTTDFGSGSPYVGAMKGVILGINPQAQMVDLCHEIHPQAIEEAAFLLAANFCFFPPDSIHVAVVDPGVGTGRRAIVARSRGAYFLAPDNGLLSHIAMEEVIELTEPGFWLNPVSNTFHGRDVFAPVAAHLSLGVKLSRLGRCLSPQELVRLPQLLASWEGGRLRGRVVHVDRFGNLITNIPKETLPQRAVSIQVAGRRIEGLSHVYEEVAEGKLLAYIGSFGFLEIACRKGSAQESLGVSRGMEVVVEVGDDL